MTLLAYTPIITDQSSISDKLAMGFKTLGLGMLVVFAVLILIWGILELFHYVFAYVTGENVKKAPVKAPAPTVAPVAPVVTAPVVPATDDMATVAAITAALAVMLDCPTTSFRVVSFRRAKKNTPWNQK